MGYMTFYNLGWTDPGLSPQETATRKDGLTEEDEAIQRWLAGDEVFSSELEDTYPYGASCWSKWEDHDEDMIRLSRAFPGVLFELQGAGEEDGDLWRTYYLAGRLQHAPAEVRYPPFDPDKLEEPYGPQAPE